MDRDSDRPRLTERDFDNMSRMELWQAYQKLERYLEIFSNNFWKSNHNAITITHLNIIYEPLGH